MSATTTTTEMTDEELIRLANEEIDRERLIVAGRLLRKVQNVRYLTERHHKVMKNAKVIEEIIEIHLTPPQAEGWKKQAESRGFRDSIIYYKVEGNSELTCRIETPIEASLLVPLLAVMNESELYDKWMPQWKFPFKMGVRQSQKLKDQPGRGAQVVQVTVDMPFPFTDREVVFDTWAVDVIDELSLIAMKGTSLDVGAENGLVQPPAPGIKRIDFDCGWVVRRCPDDHPCLNNSEHKYPEGEHLLLLSLTQYVDAHMNYVPQALINFSIRTALSGQWNSLLQVAQDVKEGKRPDHAKCIEEKQELYGWINERIEAMFSKLGQNK